MLYFFFGGVYTLAIFGLGFYLGHVLKVKIPEIQLPKPLTVPQAVTQGGAVKAISPDELRKEENKGFIERFKEITS